MRKCIKMGDNTSVTCYYAAGSVLGNSFSSKTWQIGGKITPNEWIKACPCFNAKDEYKDI